MKHVFWIFFLCCMCIYVPFISCSETMFVELKSTCSTDRAEARHASRPSNPTISSSQMMFRYFNNGFFNWGAQATARQTTLIARQGYRYILTSARPARPSNSWKDQNHLTSKACIHYKTALKTISKKKKWKLNSPNNQKFNYILLHWIRN